MKSFRVAIDTPPPPRLSEFSDVGDGRNILARSLIPHLHTTPPLPRKTKQKRFSLHLYGMIWVNCGMTLSVLIAIIIVIRIHHKSFLYTCQWWHVTLSIWYILQMELCFYMYVGYLLFSVV